MATERRTEPRAASGVTPVELFLDLVFVFTITQVAGSLEEDLTWAGAGRALLLFTVLWWMYGGYIWLTNQVPPRRTAYRLLLLVGMAGFLVTAVALPDAFSGAGVYVGVGYLVVVAVHSTLFTRASRREGLAWLVPLNLLSAALVLAAGFAHGGWVYALWLLAVGVQVLVPFLPVPFRFDLDADHFVERHGLLVLIALGETVAEIGLSLDPDRLSPGLVLVALVGLVLAAALWWSYFSGDPERATASLRAAPTERRGALGIQAYFYAHVAVLLGIVVSAAGVRAVLLDPGAPLTTAAALALAGGVALFLAGTARVRQVLRLGPAGPRAGFAGLTLLTTPLGPATTAWLQLAVLAGLAVALVLLDRHDAPDEAGQEGVRSSPG